MFSSTLLNMKYFTCDNSLITVFLSWNQFVIWIYLFFFTKLIPSDMKFYITLILIIIDAYGIESD